MHVLIQMKSIWKNIIAMRLEFLGDAVCELVSSEFLFLESPKVSKGKLTKTRASMVCEPSLAFCAREIELGSYLKGRRSDRRDVRGRL